MHKPDYIWTVHWLGKKPAIAGHSDPMLYSEALEYAKEIKADHVWLEIYDQEPQVAT